MIVVATVIQHTDFASDRMIVEKTSYAANLFQSCCESTKQVFSRDNLLCVVGQHFLQRLCCSICFQILKDWVICDLNKCIRTHLWFYMIWKMWDYSKPAMVSLDCILLLRNVFAENFIHIMLTAGKNEYKN